MAKKPANSVTPRGELVKYARELGLGDLEHSELMRVVDAALETDQPREFIDAYARERGSPPIADASAAVGRIIEVLDGAATDTVAKLEIPLATMESPQSETFAPVKVDDPEFFLRLPNLSAVACNGHQTRHVDLQLGKYPLARQTLTLLRHHLDKSNARLSTDRHATNPAAALVWLLEQYGRAAGLEVPNG